MEQKDAQKGLDQLRQKVQRVSQSITRFMVKAGVAVTALGATFIAISRSIIQTASSFEMMEIKLNALTKGKGADTLEQLNKWALTMPVNTQKAIDTFVLMKAMGLDPTIKSMETLVDVASVFGEEAMPRVARALGQMQTLGKISAEELNQMAEVGVNARKYLTAAFGKSVEELQKSGVNINKVVKAIMDGLKEEFGGASQMAMSTWQGMLTTLVSYWTEFKLSIARAGVFDMFKEDLKGVLDWVERLIKEGKFKEWAQDISNALKGVHDRVKEWILESGPQYLESLKKVATVLGNLGVMMGKLVLKIASSRVLVFGFLTAFVGLMAAGPVLAFASALTALGITIGTIVGALETLALFVMINPIVLAILGIGAVVGVIGYAFHKHADQTRQKMDDIRDALDKIPVEKQVELGLAGFEVTRDNLDIIQEKIRGLPEEREIKIKIAEVKGAEMARIETGMGFMGMGPGAGRPIPARPSVPETRPEWGEEERFEPLEEFRPRISPRVFAYKRTEGVFGPSAPPAIEDKEKILQDQSRLIEEKFRPKIDFSFLEPPSEGVEEWAKFADELGDIPIETVFDGMEEQLFGLPALYAEVTGDWSAKTDDWLSNQLEAFGMTSTEYGNMLEFQKQSLAEISQLEYEATGQRKQWTWEELQVTLDANSMNLSEHISMLEAKRAGDESYHTWWFEEMRKRSQTFSVFSSSVLKMQQQMLSGEVITAKAAAAAFTAGIAEELKVLSAKYTVMALGAMGQGFLGHPGAWAAAAQYTAAAVAAGAAGAWVGGRAEAMGGGGGVGEAGGAGVGAGGAEGGRREYGAAVRATPQNVFIQPSVSITGETVIIGRTGIDEMKETMGAAVVSATKDALETGEIDLRQYE